MKKILPYLVLVALVFGGLKTAGASEVTGSLNPGLETGISGTTKAAPTVSPAAGSYTSNQSVALSASGATAICYTTDGTTPACATSATCTTGSVYSSAISITSSKTVKSVGCYGDGSQGPAASDAYTLTCSTASVSNGSVAAYPGCAISCNSGYTLSGSSCVSSGGGGGGGGGGSSSSAPSSASITISNGAAETNIQTVNLYLFAYNADRMMVSNDANFVGASWEDYANSKTWWLPAGIGEKKVYVKFKSTTGLVSSVVSDTINLTVAGTETPPAVLVPVPATPAIIQPAPTPAPATGVPSVAPAISAVFKASFVLGAANSDIKRLQQLLNLDPDTQVAVSGAGSPGNETEYYGNLTQRAVQKFQCKYKIVCSGTPDTTGYGNLGPKTRAKLVEVFGSQAAVQLQPAPTQPVPAESQTTIGSLQSQIQNLLLMVEQLQAQLKAMQ